ncbi:hypothetical protein ABVN80_05350 [Acinetobacter baumannii]
MLDRHVLRPLLLNIEKRRQKMCVVLTDNFVKTLANHGMLLTANSRTSLAAPPKTFRSFYY